MLVVAVIPARLSSTRLPNKPLAEIHGKPMVQWVYERARGARSVGRVIVATDDQRVLSAVEGFGGECLMTSPDLKSGTDRVAAVADQVPGDIFVNVQGDEPLLDPRAIDLTVELVASGRFPMASVMTPLRGLEDLDQASAVKVIADSQARAVYFSRHPIPYSRGERPQNARDAACRLHVGLYVYDRETLMRIRSLPPSAWEKAEMLEQLRAMEAGIPIGMAELDFMSIGVDTPEDLERVRKHLGSSM